MTDDELKDLVASLAISQKETERQLQITDRQLSKQLRELGKQIGGLGDKFGGFTEGMAFPSMTKILTEQFGMEVITTRFKVRKGGDTLELNVFAYANSDRNEAYIVEVQSYLRSDGIEQLRQILGRFRRFCPEHGDKKLTVSWPWSTLPTIYATKPWPKACTWPAFTISNLSWKPREDLRRKAGSPNAGCKGNAVLPTFQGYLI